MLAGIRGRIRRSALSGDAGVGLVELLVVFALLTVIGAVASTSLIAGMRASGRGQDRVVAVSELQTGLERLTREARAANPVDVAAPGQLRVETYRGGERYRYTYTVSGGALRELREQYAAGSWSTVSDQALIDDVSSSTVFQYHAADGTTLSPTPLSLADLQRLHRVTVTVVRSLPDLDSVQVTTVITLRNSQ